MWTVLYLAKDMPASYTRSFGPFDSYLEAEDCVCRLPVAAQCEFKYITAMMSACEADWVRELNASPVASIAA